MSAKLRRIQAMPSLIDGKVSVDFGQRPELQWIDPASLLVDEAYQRNLSKRSLNVIKVVIKNFAWRKMKPPIVVSTEGKLHCVDGQHTAIAAATLNLVEIPVFVVGAASLAERADAFVAHNRDRVAMTPMDVFRARLAAMDADALDVESVCRRAGVSLKLINPTSKIMVGDSASVGTIQRLVKRQGVIKARMVLEALVVGGRAPIGSAEIHAVEAAMVLVRPATTIPEMAAAIRSLSDHGVIEAKMLAATEGKPHKHLLFEAYMNVLEKQTGVPRALAS